MGSGRNEIDSASIFSGLLNEAGTLARNMSPHAIVNPSFVYLFNLALG